MKFKDLTDYFQRLESTSKRLQMTAILAELFKSVDTKGKKDIDKIIYLCQGQLAPSFRNIEFGISEKLIHKSLVEATQSSEGEIKALFHKKGDYGEVAQYLCKGHERVLKIEEVYKHLEDLALFSGEGAVSRKVAFLAKLLRETHAQEAKYIIRIILGKLRLGIGDPTVLDSLSLAYNGDKLLRRHLERAYNLCSDLGLVAKTLFTRGIKDIKEFEVIVGCPIRVALAARLPNAGEIIEKIGTCAVEAKYDGFRCQVHKKGGQVRIFSRNLEDTTHMFPEIAEGTLKQIKEKNAIYEGEALAYDPKTGQCLSFQTTVQRKRKYDIEHMRKQYPLKIFVFDMLYAGRDLTRMPYEKRRKVMSGAVRKGNVLEISPMSIVSTADELTDVFEEAISEGREGIMAKRLDGPYQAGGRNFNWIKLKHSYSGKLNDTIDCVIVGYFFGKGLRTVFGMGSLLACVYDKKNGRFKTVAKLGSGLSEDELVKFKKMLDKVKQKDKPKGVDSVITPDVWVQPKYVVEVQADEITRSPVHTCGKTAQNDSGYALRFPRTVGSIRTDKSAQDATSVDEIVKMFNMQKGRK